MKKIGFVDYYLGEWHADNYPRLIAELSSDFEVGYAWAEKFDSPIGGSNTDEWCRDNGAKKCETLDELCRLSDYIIVLAPSNPEKHLGYAETVLKYRKNTYIDKTFAPDYATAKRIVSLAERYGTKMFSSSALRYADELDGIEATSVITQGGGSNLEEYIIHQIEMTIKLLKSRVKKVRVESAGNKQMLCRAECESGKSATMVYAPDAPFAASIEREDGTTAFLPIASDFFKNLMADILRFFASGEPSFDRAETLEVMRVREGIINALGHLGEWITLPESTL